MQEYTFQLQFIQGNQNVLLRELSGHDELNVTDLSTIGTVRLLNRLMIERTDSGEGPLKAEKIVTADRDRLLAEVYKYTYGPGIESTLNCQSCTSRFDLNFSLDDLLKHAQPEMNEVDIQKTDDGSFLTANGYHFRLPTGEDEMAVLGLTLEEAEQALLKRCLLKDSRTDNTELVQQAMEQIAPVLQMEMMATCPECGKEHQVYFDIQSYLFAKLIIDQNRVAAEVHCLASTYHWGHNEILDLPRSLRRTYVDFIKSESDESKYRFK